MKRLVKGIALVLAMMTTTAATAQDKVEATVGTDIVSSYVWRGLNLGSAAIQPTVGVAWKGLSLSAWGSLGFVNTADAKELDLALSYNVAGLTIGVTDYFIAEGPKDCPVKYFKYDGDGSHVLEASIGYDFGFLSATWNTNFLNDDDYASYLELKAPFKLGVDWEAAVGIAPYKSGAYFNDGFACTNISLKASKDIKITDHFSLPVFGQLAANPNDGKFYLAFGLSLGL